ncbi:hypothetical protein Bpfe_015690 [Biomphalaria pfeifferi]|uniref:Uncharacterized protein n=1 Tax=Biomphalaria pfeifferi TaxID=112525 RepID=A0AAD8F9C5_BIOPF|nr:hypothetical protein Bpfe_015690 [Biomphalaria pfeifferi]
MTSAGLETMAIVLTVWSEYVTTSQSDNRFSWHIEYHTTSQSDNRLSCHIEYHLTSQSDNRLSCHNVIDLLNSAVKGCCIVLLSDYQWLVAK